MGQSDYLQRRAMYGPLIDASPVVGLQMVVVIPVHDEPDIISVLESLWRCERPDCGVEVILMVNGSGADASVVRVRNQATSRTVAHWAVNHRDETLRFHVLSFLDLPPRHAGVGLARKIGMDEGVRRLRDAGCESGILVALDADCTCREDYLAAIERHFRNEPSTPGCSIYFEHPLAGPDKEEVYRAIVLYELHLRYYVQALRFAGFAFAHHTVGSSMAVRAAVYEREGGMNKRKAGEDFYFLHKIIPLGDYSDLIDTAVYPSPRVSERVPFGTGRAVKDYLEGSSLAFASYPMAAFRDMRQFLDGLSEWMDRSAGCVDSFLEGMPDSVRSYLHGQGFEGAVEEAKRHSGSPAAFRKRLLLWFNGFRAMKFVHHARDNFYGAVSVEDEARRLLRMIEWDDCNPVTSAIPKAGGEPERDSVTLLLRFRRLDLAGFTGAVSPRPSGQSDPGFPENPASSARGPRHR